MYVTRLFARHFVTKDTGFDDLAMGAALICTLGYLVELIVAWAAFGVGKSDFAPSRSNAIGLAKVRCRCDIDHHRAFAEHSQQISVAIEATYFATITLVKASVVLLYMRIGMLA